VGLQHSGSPIKFLANPWEKAVRMKKVKDLVPLFMPYVKRIFDNSDHSVCLRNIKMVFQTRPTVRIIFSNMLLANTLLIYYSFIYLLTYLRDYQHVLVNNKPSAGNNMITTWEVTECFTICEVPYFKS
jgi:hypothetical protein